MRLLARPLGLDRHGKDAECKRQAESKASRDKWHIRKKLQRDPQHTDEVVEIGTDRQELAPTGRNYTVPESISFRVAVETCPLEHQRAAVLRQRSVTLSPRGACRLFA